MQRIVLMFIRSFFHLPYYLIMLKVLTNTKKHDRFERYEFLHKRAGDAIRRGRVKVIIEGEENMPKEDGFIITPNHQGLFDCLTFLKFMDRPFATVMKKELRNVFLLRDVITLLSAEIIDRENVRQAITVINDMTERIKNGENFIIFPEGTRSKKGNEIGTFKAGSFKCAMNAHCPIVPAALVDSFLPFDSGTIKPVTVKLFILKPLYYENYKGMKSQEIAELVSGMIREKIKEDVNTAGA